MTVLRAMSDAFIVVAKACVVHWIAHSVLASPRTEARSAVRAIVNPLEVTREVIVSQLSLRIGMRRTQTRRDLPALWQHVGGWIVCE